MITLPELLEDPVYKKFFSTQPHLPQVAKSSTSPWRIHARMKGVPGWKTEDFKTYTEAFLFYKEHKSIIVDAAINCRRYQFKPPTRTVRIKGKYFILPGSGERKQMIREVVWKPKLPENEETHHWCPYCRRPVVFRYFRKHHALRFIAKGIDMDPTVLRCTFCGVSERLVTLK